MYTSRIKEIRKKLGLSVAKMADKINIPARTITSYERGERTPSIEFCAQMYNILNININWFVSGQGEIFNAQYNTEKNNLRSEVIKILKEEGLLK